MNKILDNITHRFTALMRQTIILSSAIIVSTGICLAAGPVSLHVKDMKVEKIISKIRKENPSYKFLFNHEEIKNVGTKTISADKVSIDSVMDKLLENTGLEYQIKNNVIVIRPSKTPNPSGITVRGQVFDDKGETVPNVTVAAIHCNKSVLTDSDGNFSINLPDGDDILSFFMIGMENVKVNIGNERYFKIILRDFAHTMTEVVATGYQNLKRENSTGSYQVITSRQLDRKSSADIVSRLEGLVPGLVLNPQSMSKDEDSYIIRGVGTFRAKTSPLVVVDGLPIEGGMSTVNPYDIDNITVLKDAAASSIYGARASNGVIVITTKQAKGQRLQVDVNADVTVSERQDYSNYGWANAAQMIELERHNFNALLNEEGQPTLNSMLADWNNNRRGGFSKVSRLFLANFNGELSDADMNSTLADWAGNAYRREYRDVHDRSQVTQLYNVALRYQGNALRSSLNVSYAMDNMGVQKENGNTLTFKYRGDLTACRWLDLSFGVNVLNTRNKTHDLGEYGYINSFLPYQSMYDALGNRVGMEANIYSAHDAFSNPAYGLKDNSFNLADEMDRNFSKYRYTNTRTFIHANFNILPGWKATAQFQYEDIFSRSQTLHEADSYLMRNAFNVYTTDNTTQTTHNVPDGGSLQTTTMESQFYTFRAQTSYNNTFGKHAIDALAGFEYRQTHTTYDSSTLLGYDDATQSNLNLLANWGYINNPTTNVFGSDVPVYGAPATFSTSDVLHRYYSMYLVANYAYDGRYALSASYRVDKTDLFGTDPKFRGRPLWSVGASWNAHNEAFLRDITWLNALKVRASYGLAGNIDPNSTSYLTARISTNHITGGKVGYLQTPPNDQLRWEKTSTWNAGLDFSLLNYRLNGSLDFYSKSGSDLLTVTDLDCTTGWSSLTINSGNMVNRGVELQLDGNIIPQTSRRSLGVSIGLNLAYNHNEVTGVSHEVHTGADYLNPSYLHKGYPMGSLFSFDYTGLREIDGLYYMGWRDKEGNEHTSSIGSSEFTKADVIYSGPATPTWTGALTPTVMWNGFSLSAMLNYYGGHYMRVGNDEWTTSGGAYGYGNSFGQSAMPGTALEYWHGNKDYPANGYLSKDYKYLGYSSYRSTNVVHADYLKVRNIMLSYNFEPKLCRRIGFSDIRLRFQMNNVATWARNGRSLDPEAVSGGMHIDRVPRSYTFSIFFSL